MKRHYDYRSPLALFLAVCLSLPGAAFGAGKSGKKYFKEGARCESVERWDLAAEQYALAVSEEPGNAEYRLRFLRATQMASLMFTARGDTLEAKADYEGAYGAYARAYTYDQTNETARIKMSRMMEQQRAKEGLGEVARYNPRNGNLTPINNEIQTSQRPARGDVMQKIDFSDGSSLKLVILNLARQLNLNVIFDESFKDNAKFSISLTDVSLPKALDLVLLQNKLIFEQADRRTIVIYADNPTNRQRLEKLLVKTFYLSNADPNETRTLIQANLGAQRQVNISKQLNALVIRATASELAVAQSLIDNLDKNRSEVVLDVNIYEVSNSTSLQIGNQIASTGLATTKTTYDTNGNPVTVTTGTSSSLTDLGGVGRASVSAIAGNLFGVGGGVGTIIGIPPSSLSLLQSKGASKLLASTQVHGLDGEQNQTVVGRSVPIRTGTNFLNGTTPTSSTTTNGSGYTVDNIQYRDVGLVIDVTPVITNEGYVQVKMKLESSNVEASGTDTTLTPSFTKRSLTTISRVQDGLTAVVACVKQDSKGDSRVSIPVVGMVPILGRLFTAPAQTSSQSDIVITVTPHIIRPAEIRPEDHLARGSGTQQSGASQYIEDVIFRAQAEEDQERRAIARQSTSAPLGPVEASVNLPASTPPPQRPEIIPANQPGASPPVTPAVVKPSIPPERRLQ
jgi:general secretion pathway protein D